MNVGQAKRIVESLVGLHYLRDIENVINIYFDIAQKQIATTVDFIERVWKPCGDGLVDLPPDFYSIKRVSGADGWKMEGARQIFLKSGEYKIVYNALPTTINAKTPDSHEFEISECGQSAIAFFAAAQAVITEDDMRPYYALCDRYNHILQNISAGGSGMVQVVEILD